MKRKTRIAPMLAIMALFVAPIGPAMAAPGNDNLADATLVTSLPYATTIDATHATREAGEAISPCNPYAGESVWYRYTPTTDQRLDLTTAGSSYNTVLTVFDGTPVYPGTEFACDDDGVAPQGASHLRFSAVPGHTYNIQIAAWSDIAGTPVSGTLVFAMTSVTDQSVAGCGACDFAIYPVPSQFNFGAGETSIGVNPATDRAIFLLLSHAMRASWDDSTSPPAVTWKEVTGPMSRQGTNDPILWTDRATGRTFVVQLHVLGAAGASLMEYTEDDGDTWHTVEPGQVNPSWDHESLGGGPSPLALPARPYPNTLYYCAQLGAPFSQCQRSHDGGVTWDAGLPMNTGSCAGLHGHIQVGPNGTVYIPHKSCSAGQTVMQSTNEGLLWTPNVTPIAGSSRSDPALGIDTTGRLYFAAVSNGHAVVTVQDDAFAQWTTPIDIGASFGIKNVEQPMAVAGDDGRAAVAFYGTPTAGNDQAADFTGVWHMYVSLTYDAGRTWTTQDITPDDPVQRGCIWMGGGSSPCRNLLDFQQMTIDGHGRVLVGYADGCVSAVCVGPTGTPDDSHNSRGTIARQISGKPLIAAFDP